MITEQMVDTVDHILGNAVRVGARSQLPIKQAEMLTDVQLAQYELTGLVKSLQDPICEFIVRGHMSPNGMIRRQTLFDRGPADGGQLGHTQVSAEVNLLSNEEISYLVTFMMKLRQSRLQAGMDATTRPN